jgi:hypothetical protein
MAYIWNRFDSGTPLVISLRKQSMNYRVFGVGLVVLCGSLLGCSGKTQTPSPPASANNGDAGSSGTDRDGSLGDAGSAPGCAVDADCAQGVCDPIQHACVECRTDKVCGDGKRCSDAGKCVDATPCTPGSYTCDGQTLQKCSADGSPVFERTCSKSEYCDERRAQCEPQVCTPGEASCAEGAVRICNDEGSDYVPKQLCSLKQVCRDGACQDIACVPNTTFCSDGDVWTCGSDGTTSQESDHCAAAEFCLEKGPVATCSPTACFANDPMCVGNLATQCAPDGSGPKAGGTDCTASNQVCYSGSCKDALCVPGLKLCDANQLYLCSEAGTSKTLITDCGTTAACDASSGTCKPRICDPGKLGCDTTRVVTCNDSGTGWLQSGPDCAASHGLCAAGTCKPIICTPNGEFCDSSNDIVTCSADGTGSTLYEACGSSYHCSPSSSNYAYCSSYYCTPSAAGCNGNLLTTCKADGSAWVTGGTDCSLNNGVCSNAQCKTKVCTPNSTFCSDGNVLQCDYQGLSSYQYTTCGYAKYCKAQGSTASCVPTPCLPGSTGCASEKYGQCAQDGLSVTGGTDCAAATQVCTAQGCAASAVDSIGSSNFVTGGSYYNLFGDVLEVTSARKLTTIEAYLTLPTSGNLVWAVYQKDVINTYPTYDLKFQKTTTASGTGFQSSGTLSFELTAGGSYLIGVAVSGGSFAYYYDTAITPPLINFASVTGGVATTFSTTLSYPYATLSNLYDIRLTTTVP